MGTTRFGKETRNRVYAYIIRAGENGISNKDLVKLCQINRNTITIICNSLKKEGSIKIIKNGKWSTYCVEHNNKSPVYLSKEKSGLLSQLLTRKFIDQINHPLNYRILSETFESQLNYLNELSFKRIESTESPNHLQNYDINLYSSDDLSTLKKRDLAIALQSFVLKIGTMISFLLIKYTSQNFSNEISNRYNPNQDKLHHDVTNIAVETSLGGSMSPKIMLHHFNEMLLKSGYSESMFEEKIEEHRYAVHPFITEHLTQVFKNSYPAIYEKLERIYDDLPKSIEDAVKRKRQRICQHDFTLAKSEDERSIIYSCTECTLTVEQSKNKQITDLRLIEILNKKCKGNRSNIGPPHLILNGKEIWHVWEFVPTSENAFNEKTKIEEKYYCILCKSKSRIQILSKATMMQLRRKFDEIIGDSDYKIKIFDLIAFTFYRNPGRLFKNNDFRDLYKGKPEIFVKVLNNSNIEKKIEVNYSLSDFKDDINKMLHLLEKCEFIVKASNTKSKSKSNEYIYGKMSYYSYMP